MTGSGEQTLPLSGTTSADGAASAKMTQPPAVAATTAPAGTPSSARWASASASAAWASTAAFSERLWSWLKAVPVNAGQTALLVVTDAPGPGHRRRAMVILDIGDWEQLHRNENPSED
jgi:hypothetical protein